MREKQTKIPFTLKHNNWVNDFSIKQIKEINPNIVCDVGIGDGFWGKLVDYLLTEVNITGIELNPKWVQHSQPYYDTIISGSITNNIENISGDLIIFGDVLEHLDKINMEYVLKVAVKNFKWVLINGPVGFQPQEHEDVEEHHLCGITKDDLIIYNIVEYNELPDVMMNCLIKGDN